MNNPPLSSTMNAPVRPRSSLPIQLTALAALIFLISPARVTAAELPRTITVDAPTGNATTDTENIQTAFTAARDAYVQSGSPAFSGVIVKFQPGTYVINNRVDFTVRSTDSHPTTEGGIMIRGTLNSSGAKTQIQSSGTSGAFLFNIDITTANGGYQSWLQIEDLEFKATAPGAGPAIEMNATGTTSQYVIYPVLKNITIGRTGSNYYTYGIKGSYLRGPLLDTISFTGSKASTVAGVYFTNTYAHNIKDCTINGAQTGIQHEYGGEGHMINRVNISNVATGIRINNVRFYVLMSTNGGALLNSTISASSTGIYMHLKSYFFIDHNTFLSNAGSADYRDVKLECCSNAYVTNNTFQEAGTNTNRTAITIGHAADTCDACKTLSISDNVVGAPGTPLKCGIEVNSPMSETMIYDNTINAATPVADTGIGTFYRTGTANQITYDLTNTKDAEAASSWTWLSDPTNYPVFDVKAYGALGNDNAGDTQKIKNAVTAMKAWLDGNSDRKAVLYFPAGTYALYDQISITEAASGQWNNVIICGDGMGVSNLRWTSTSTGTDALDLNLGSISKQCRVDVHNLRIVASSAGTGPMAGAGLKITQAAPAAGDRSLYMHEVLMTGKTGTDYFARAVSGTKLTRPFFENVSINMNETGTTPVGTAGIYLRDGIGYESDKAVVFKRLETAFDIQVTGGDVVFKNGLALTVGANIGLKINAGGTGSIKIDAVHNNSTTINLDLSNAAHLRYTNTQMLHNGDDSDAEGHAGVKLNNCADVLIKNNIFAKSTPEEGYNPSRKSLWFVTSASGNKVVGNVFREPVDTCITVEGTGPLEVTDNRFSSVSSGNVENFYPPQPGLDLLFTANNTYTPTRRTYELNGETDKYYMLQNKWSGQCLSRKSDGSLEFVAPPTPQQNPADPTNPFNQILSAPDAMQWKVTYTGNGTYSLQNKSASNYLTGSNSPYTVSLTSLTGSLTDFQKWTIVNRNDTYYTLKCKGVSTNYGHLKQPTTTTVDCSAAGAIDRSEWDLLLLDVD